jgi:hypothetical protein
MSTKTVKFEVLKEFAEIEELYLTIQQKCANIEAIKGDNEGQTLAKTLRHSATHDKNLLHRAILEAKELW